jgi:hypothetical protein
MSESEISFLITRYVSAHYHWGIVHGIGAQGRLKVEPARMRRFSFLERTISRFVTCPP